MDSTLLALAKYATSKGVEVMNPERNADAVGVTCFAIGGLIVFLCGNV